MAWAEEDVVANGKLARLHLSGTSRQAAAHTRTRIHTRAYAYARTHTRAHAHARAHTPQVCTAILHQWWPLEPLVPCMPPEAATSNVEVDRMIPPTTIHR